MGWIAAVLLLFFLAYADQITSIMENLAEEDSCTVQEEDNGN